MSKVIEKSYSRVLAAKSQEENKKAIDEYIQTLKDAGEYKNETRILMYRRDDSGNRIDDIEQVTRIACPSGSKDTYIGPDDDGNYILLVEEVSQGITYRTQIFTNTTDLARAIYLLDPLFEPNGLKVEFHSLRYKHACVECYWEISKSNPTKSNKVIGFAKKKKK